MRRVTLRIVTGRDGVSSVQQVIDGVVIAASTRLAADGRLARPPLYPEDDPLQSLAGEWGVTVDELMAVGVKR